MFTGIVEDLGEVIAVERRDTSARITVRGSVVHDAEPGDSIAVNGVCLTVVGTQADTFDADVMNETLRRSALRDVRPGDRVNLERAVTLRTRLGGHVVQGHVDGVATVVRRQPGEAWDEVTLELSPDLVRYVVEKGSIALDGVSLTVMAVDGVQVTVGLIPETLRRTTWGSRATGELVNVEVDVLAKYVERLLDARLEKS